MHQYGDITAMFHGKAEDLRKLAPLVWDKPDLKELKELLQINPELAPEAEITIHVSLFNNPLWYELPCIDFLANHSPGVEIAVVARISNSITDMAGRCSQFYPLDREFDEYDEDEEDDEDEYDEDYDAMNYVDYIEDSMEVKATLTGFAGDEYEINLADETIRPAGWNFYQEDPDVLEFLGDTDFEEILKPFQAVLVKCNPETGDVTCVEGDAAKFGSEHSGAFAEILPEVSIRTEEKDGKRFYLDAEGNEYFFLGDLSLEEIRFGRTRAGWFDAYPDRPAWLREWESSC